MSTIIKVDIPKNMTLQIYHFLKEVELKTIKELAKIYDFNVDDAVKQIGVENKTHKKLNNKKKNELNNEINTNKKAMSIKQNEKNKTNTTKIISKKQRTVSENLGKNNTFHHEKIYDFIEKNIGPTKKCNFGHKRGSKTGIKHEGPPNVPIREFPLKGCSVNTNNEIKITNGDGLQGFCINCDSRRRKKRLETCREKNKEGYDTYEKEYCKITKECSQCKRDKNVRECFKLSPSMECGIHNVCNDCSKLYGESMGDRLIKYRPDGNFKYKKTAENQHDDHIMPLAYGGTNEGANHQLIPAKENLSKSSTIQFENVNDIPNSLLCERWRHILEEAKKENISITVYKSRISNAILEEQKYIYSMTDEEIKDIYKQYNTTNNRRVNTKRAVEKFKKYCKEILKL